MKLSPEHFVSLLKKSHSLDHVYMLQLMKQGYPVKNLCEESLRVKAIFDTLVRKGLCTKNGRVTLLGQDILDFLDDDNLTTIPTKQLDHKGFDDWWKAYPGTNTFSYKGVMFNGTRGLRVKKEECKAKFHAIIMEGEYTVEKLIKALELEVLQKKEASVQQKENKLTYMQNSLTYLNQRTYEPYIELVEQNVTIDKQASKGVTDI